MTKNTPRTPTKTRSSHPRTPLAPVKTQTEIGFRTPVGKKTKLPLAAIDPQLEEKLNHHWRNFQMWFEGGSESDDFYRGNYKEWDRLTRFSDTYRKNHASQSVCRKLDMSSESPN